MEIKRVLFYFPENPLLKNAGNKTRALELLYYFQNKNFIVDFVSDDLINFYNENEVNEFKNKKLANDVIILRRKPDKKNYLKYLIKHKIPNKFYKKEFLSRIYYNHIVKFAELVEKNNYDFIVLSYIYSIDLLRKLKNKTKIKIIIDTHDFITANFSYLKNNKLGYSFQKEIEYLNKADQVWAISNDEYYIFNQFCKSEVKLIPFWKDDMTERSKVEHKYDIIYVASDNPHNIKSCNWFFREVFPYLPNNYKICVIGKITNHINDYANVMKIPFAEDLAQYYQKSKISICPMLSGTGTKVKVIESLSFGLPVVCTLRGIDGLVNKTNNGCLVSNNTKDFASNIVNLLENNHIYIEHKSEAIKFFKENYSKEICYEKLDSLFNEI